MYVREAFLGVFGTLLLISFTGADMIWPTYKLITRNTVTLNYNICKGQTTRSRDDIKGFGVFSTAKEANSLWYFCCAKAHNQRWVDKKANQIWINMSPSARWADEADEQQNSRHRLKHKGSRTNKRKCTCVGMYYLKSKAPNKINFKNNYCRLLVLQQKGFWFTLYALTFIRGRIISALKYLKIHNFHLCMSNSRLKWI